MKKIGAREGLAKIALKCPSKATGARSQTDFAPSVHPIPSNRMASSQSSVTSTSSSISTLSVGSSTSATVEEARRREEVENMRIINALELFPTCSNTNRPSPLWRKRYYFTSTHKDHKKDVYCLKCKVWIKFGSHSHVEQHERNKHGGSGGTVTSGGGSGGGGMQQLKLNQTVALKGEPQARLTAHIVGFLIQDGRPAALTLGRGFRQLMHAMNPRFVMPGLKKIKMFTDAMYDQARDVILAYIHPLKQKGPAALRGMVGCVSLDLWTDITQVEYMGVILHTTKETHAGYEQKEILLACTEVDATHITSQVVKDYLLSVLKDFGLPVKSIFRSIHDGDAKVIKGVREAPLPSSLCFIHSLQRTIAVSLKDVDEVLTLLTRTKKAVAGVRQSNVQASYLREAQVSIGAPQRALVQDNQTRWGSTHDMAERATEQRASFPQAYALDDERNQQQTYKVFDPAKRLTPGDFTLLGQVVAIYKPFRKVTTELQSAGITSSFVVPSYMQLLDDVDSTLKIEVKMPAAGTLYPATSVTTQVSELPRPVVQIARQARTDLIKRFNLQRMIAFAVATCLDPRFKNLKAFKVPDDVCKRVWHVIHVQTDRTITVLKEAGQYHEEERGDKRGADGQPKRDGSWVSALNAKAMQCNDMPVGTLPTAVGPALQTALDFGGVELMNGAALAVEIGTYMRKPVAELGIDKPDALQLWWGLKKECPALAIVAMHYLSIPASSSSVERLFSQTGLIKSKLRNRLLPETLQKLVFTRGNWDDSLLQVRPKKKAVGVEESKGGEADEEDEEEDEDGEELWVDLEREVAGELDREIRPEDDLGLDRLMGLHFEEPDDDFWKEFEDQEEPWLDAEN